MIALPVGGAVSDGTRSRFGRRAPWIVLMAITAAALMVVMGLATALPLLAVAYMLLWFAANFYQGAAAAILPDRAGAQPATSASSPSPPGCRRYCPRR